MYRIATVAASFALAACLITAATAANLEGAGSSNIYPVLVLWAQKYEKKTGTKVSFQSIGSGGGIAQIKAKRVDFAITEAPLSHDHLVAAGLVQFPLVALAVVPVVNVPGIKSGDLVLDGPTLADIYLGKIGKWNDAAIRKWNPTITLPDLAIQVIHRADASGTTLSFTDYLSKVSPAWKAKVGAGTAVDWPAGIGSKGCCGPAATVQETSGAIGYIEYAYGKQNNLVTVDLINADGRRVTPSGEAFQSAVAHAAFGKVQDYCLILTNQPGAKSWPIMVTSFVLLRTDLGPVKTREILKFFAYALTEGEADSRKLDYATFPAATIKEIEASWTANLKAWP